MLLMMRMPLLLPSRILLLPLLFILRLLLLPAYSFCLSVFVIPESLDG
jgi:hypothetical protein